MIKKLPFIIITLLIAGNIYARSSKAPNRFAIGVVWDTHVGFGGDTSLGGALVSFKLKSVPFVFGAGLSISRNVFTVHGIADYWIWYWKIEGPFNIYLGPGAYARIQLGDKTTIDAGARLPLGLQFLFGDNDFFEVFIEPALSLGIGIGFESGVSFPRAGLQTALGVRFWFK